MGSWGARERVGGREEAALTSLDIGGEGLGWGVGSGGRGGAMTVGGGLLFIVSRLLGIDAAEPLYGCETESYGCRADK